MIHRQALHCVPAGSGSLPAAARFGYSPRPPSGRSGPAPPFDKNVAACHHRYYRVRLRVESTGPAALAVGVAFDEFALREVSRPLLRPGARELASETLAWLSRTGPNRPL